MSLMLRLMIPDIYWCSGCEASKENLLPKVATKEFKPLVRVAVIQTIDIFIRGCYL